MGQCCIQPDGSLLSERPDHQANVASPASCQDVDKDTMRFLSEVRLFKRLPPDCINLLATSFVKTDFEKDTSFIKQGEPGNEFFVITSGIVAVIVDGNKVASLTSGDYLGENALLRDEPRNATITAETHVSTIKLSRLKFRQYGLTDRLEFTKRNAVGAAALRNVEVKPPTEKTEADRLVMMKALKANENLNSMVTLDDHKMDAMIDVCWEDTVRTGHDLISQGSTDADYFYIVKSGSFEIKIAKGAGGTQSADKAAASKVESVGTWGSGMSFGELALHYFTPRAATVTALAESTVWVIDRQNFKSILAKSNDDSEKIVKYLDNVKIFAELKSDEKLEVARNMNDANFTAGEAVFEQGEPGKALYILVKGEVSVVKDGVEVAKLKASEDKCEVFGELALVNSEPRAATIKVVSDTATTLYMDKLSFDMLLGPLQDLQKRGKDGEGLVTKTRPSQAQRRSRPMIYRKDLKRIGLLGCGGFGAVELVEHSATKETYALKVLSKGHVVRCGMTKGVMHEKNIQMMCDSKFIIKLYETYNGPQSLYFLLELSLGGELYATYTKKGFHGSADHAKFYIAGTVYAFEHLHERKIIFRDLKPENLLITELGHVKLTDMGLAKVTVGKTYTTCGTPDYFAPELVSSVGHTHAVDWWTLGILIFELMAGHAPFEAPAPMQIYAKVQRGIAKVTFPANLKGPCEELVKALLTKDPSARLPMKKDGINNIRTHLWFKGFDWDAMNALTLEPPYKPVVKNKKDFANFSASQDDLPPQLKYKDDGTGWDDDFATCYM